MDIIARILARWLRRTRPTSPPVYDQLPGLSPEQVDTIRREDEARHNGRPR